MRAGEVSDTVPGTLHALPHCACLKGEGKEGSQGYKFARGHGILMKIHTQRV